MWKLTVDLTLSTPDEPEDIVIDFEKGMLKRQFLCP
jgi:hypothetical protein